MLELLKRFQAKQSLYEDLVGKIIDTSPTGGTFIDCGANWGLHTARMLARTDVTTVFAVEAIPALCDNLWKRYGSLEKFQLVRAAVGKENGEVEFNISVDDMGFSGILRRDISPISEWRKVNVHLTTLDSCVSEYISNVGLIKLDLEGGEFDALRGGDTLIRSSRPLIVFENGLRKSAEVYGYGVEEFFSFFGNHGYEVLDFFGNHVDRHYWDGVLRTYMFCAVPRGSVLEEWYRANIEAFAWAIAQESAS